MKTLNELGISPAPWSEHFRRDIRCGFMNSDEDARLIAAAPELYECLREAVVEYCHDCPNCAETETYKCLEEHGKCFVRKWRSALRKAAGEEARNDIR